MKHSLVLPALLVLSLASFPGCSRVHPVIRDRFDDLASWHAVTSHGDASRLSLSADTGRSGNALLMQYAFLGHMGSVAVEKRFGVPLPDNFQLSLDIRGEGLPNNFVIRLMDSLGNVWWINRANFTLPPDWTKLTIRKSQFQYGWGPSGGGELRTLDRIMMMIDVVEGGKGKLWLGDLAIEPLGEDVRSPAAVSASSWEEGYAPRVNGDGTLVTGWRRLKGVNDGWLQVDCGSERDLGGLVIDWEPGRQAESFDVLLSSDGVSWRPGYASKQCSAVRNFVYLGSASARYVRLVLKGSLSKSGFGIVRLELKGPEFGFSLNDFFRGIAAISPGGRFPRYMVGEQSYWTIVGAPGDARKALVNEEGMIETDRLSCSLDPFISVGGRLVTWHDVARTQTLEEGYLPIPSVRWQTADALSLTTTVLAAGETGESSLCVRYRLENGSPRKLGGKLFIAIRPFQVNPPWQTFTIVGGVTRIDSITYDGNVHVNGVTVVPLSHPSAFGAAAFDAGDITQYLEKGSVPVAQSAADKLGLASAALEYDFDLPPGGTEEAVLAVPYHGSRSPLPVIRADGDAASRWFDGTRAQTAADWKSILGNVSVSLPAGAREITNTVRTNLAYILINADGPALQPGARSYQRSWIRDGALTSAALLQMGIGSPVRRYIDWYSGYQFADGMIPAVVEARGPEPTPENDSHGEFLYMIREYFSFTRDTAWLAGKWDRVLKTAQYITALRALRKTGKYVGGTAEERACFGLLPASISHEGYCPAPMHSYWDDYFALRGLRDAAFIAGVLGKKEAADIGAESADFGSDLLRSLRQAIVNRNIRFIPGCVELGDFSGLSTTVAVTPCQVVDVMPVRETKFTFDESYRMFRARQTDSAAWDSYLPYEARFIGTYVLLDEKEKAGAILDYLMHDRRPASWNEWAEVVWRNPRAPKSIGDMPHSWAASDFIRSFRTMLAYESEYDSSLVLCAGIPDGWVRDTAGISVKNLPTHYGPLSYTVRGDADSVVVEIAGGTDIPAGNILIRSPLAVPPRSIAGGARADAGKRTAVVSKLPARIVFTY